MRSKFRTLLAAIVPLVGFLSSPAFAADATSAPETGATVADNALLARVGNREIRQIDWQRKIAIERIYAGDKLAMPDADAFAMLVRDQVECAVAESLQIAPDETECRALAAHARKNTLQPQKLEAILALFAGDEAAANRLFWQPRLANRKLFSAFQLLEPELNRPARERAEAILSTARTTGNLGDAARAGGAEFETLTQARKTDDGLPLKTPADFANARPGGASALLALGQDMTAGEIHPVVQESPTEFSVVRLVEKSEDAMRFEVVHIAKVRWDEWLKLRARQSAAVRVFEPSLSARVRNASNAWWATQIN